MTSSKDFPYTYLNLKSTQDFLNTARSYIAFCDSLVSTVPSLEVLYHLRPFISEIYLKAEKMENIVNDWPSEFKEISTGNDARYIELVRFLNESIGSETTCNLENKLGLFEEKGKSFFVNELFTDLYSSFKDILFRIESLASPTEIQVGLKYIQHGFRSSWGPECASYLLANNFKINGTSSITLQVNQKPFGLN
jgi:hypothetical protein